MSLRRRSCDACFRGRRKCDLTIPTCRRCERTGKTCYYTGGSGPLLIDYSGATTASTTAKEAPNAGVDVFCSHEVHRDSAQAFSLDLDSRDFDFSFEIPTLAPIASSFLDELGNLSHAHDEANSWQWVAEQMRNCPAEFAKTGQNMFIHGSTYRHHPPQAIKTAFGICTSSLMVTSATKAIFIDSLESEVGALLSDTHVGGVVEILAQFQAMALYQILRLLFSDATQRHAAEQQKTAINAWALRLLQKTRLEIGRPQSNEDLIVTESVRRAVVVVYMLHAIGSLSKYGVCTELATLVLLPITIDSQLWNSNSMPLVFPTGDDLRTMKYGEWTDVWVAIRPRPVLDTFQKMIMVACKGKAKVEELEMETV